ncbi:hypothetical protein ACFXPT_09185 [Streptomyces goshikiensis]|uniref:hypothetical protein n=1 Tax=Streptomyces goshikiensis TaxID=1942 RepID=UPI0036C8F84C
MALSVLSTAAAVLASNDKRSLSEVGLQFIIALGVGLVTSSLALVYRCWDKGYLLGTRSSCRRAIAVIAATAGAAALVGTALPWVASVVPPWAVGAAGPALLDIQKVPKPKNAASNEDQLRRVLTLWVDRLVDKLDGQLSYDREMWIKAHVNPGWTPAELRDAAEDLDGRLVPFLASKPARTRKIKSACDAVVNNTRLAEAGDWDGPVTPPEARNAAEEAFKRLLGYAYDWRRKELAILQARDEVEAAQ